MQTEKHLIILDHAFYIILWVQKYFSLVYLFAKNSLVDRDIGEEGIIYIGFSSELVQLEIGQKSDKWSAISLNPFISLQP